MTFAPPAAAGPGTTSTPAASFLARTVSTLRIRGAGLGIGRFDDNCTFTCAPYVSSQGRFSCRVAALQGTSAPVPTGAMVGLMARADLGSESASVALVVDVGQGVALFDRSTARGFSSEEVPPGAPASPGLLQGSAILRATSKALTNVLLRPVWLRLDVADDRWMAYTSLDGKTWRRAAGAAVWVGLCVTSGVSGEFVQATCDNLVGFNPSRTVQIGVV